MSDAPQPGAEIPTVTEQAYGQKLLEKLDGRSFPFNGQWELTCRCNFKCVMCYTDPFNTPERIRQELRTEEIIRILDELREAGCVALTLTGGEPFARKDFLDIYTAAKKKGLLLTIFTNGTLITPKVADHLAAYPPQMIEISFHGLTPTSFDDVTQVSGSFERCLEGIRLLLECKLPVTLKSLGMTLNRDEILKIKALVESFGDVQYKFGSGLRPRLDGSTDVAQYQLPVDDIRAIEQADSEFRAERARQDCVREDALRQGEARCGGGTYKFHIDAHGMLQLCSNNRRQSYDLRHGSFREGFYEALPGFPCPNRTQKLVQLAVSR